MPQDEAFISATPREMTDEFQALRRAPAVRHHSKRGFSQAFRGVVGCNQTVNLHTNWPIDWSPALAEARTTSELTIITSNNRVGTGTVVSHQEKVEKSKANPSRVKQVWGAASKLNRIRGIIRAPIDQVLDMEIAFGDEYSADNLWRGTYASGGNYKLVSASPASAAMIRLTCNNPINPAPFNFTVVITLIPAIASAAIPQNAASAGVGFFDDLSDTFWSGIRKIENGWRF
ncbi:hypothetical protein JMM63_21120 [Rhodovulum sulfidophilum]|uniref:hypothetical protein n=1 Tax=Rhodovulum sulfidophilum TaxID=35806 RepID=UPI0019237740|nr:hypothetical protein [Rhodovulum sulfidophilum]MBL3598015.1 hypothetical protein [Rhodovulum sulfidophilum]